MIRAERARIIIEKMSGMGFLGVDVQVCAICALQLPQLTERSARNESKQIKQLIEYDRVPKRIPKRTRTGEDWPSFGEDLKSLALKAFPDLN